MSTPSTEQQQHDNATLASVVQEYVSHRNARLAEIVQILMQDRREYLICNAILESNPELKKNLARNGLPALKDVMRRDLFPLNPEMNKGDRE